MHKIKAKIDPILWAHAQINLLLRGKKLNSAQKKQSIKNIDLYFVLLIETRQFFELKELIKFCIKKEITSRYLTTACVYLLEYKAQKVTDTTLKKIFKLNSKNEIFNYLISNNHQALLQPYYLKLIDKKNIEIKEQLNFLNEKLNFVTKNKLSEKVYSTLIDLKTLTPFNKDLEEKLTHFEKVETYNFLNKVTKNKLKKKKFTVKKVNLDILNTIKAWLNSANKQSIKSICINLVISGEEQYILELCKSKAIKEKIPKEILFQCYQNNNLNIDALTIINEMIYNCKDKEILEKYTDKKKKLLNRIEQELAS